MSLRNPRRAEKPHEGCIMKSTRTQKIKQRFSTRVGSRQCCCETNKTRKLNLISPTKSYNYAEHDEATIEVALVIINSLLQAAPWNQEIFLEDETKHFCAFYVAFFKLVISVDWLRWESSSLWSLSSALSNAGFGYCDEP